MARTTGTGKANLVNRRVGELVNHQVTKSPSHQVRGFTLIELLVVLSIIIILASVGLAQYKNSVTHASEAVLRDDLTKMREAIDQYYADKGQYPGTLDSLVSDGYLRKIPEDPFTKSSSSWQTIPAEPDPNNPTGQAGVYDVKSGSDGTGLNGTKHSDW